MNRILVIIGIGLITVVFLVLVIFGVNNFKGGLTASQSKPIESLIKDNKLDEAKNKLDALAGEKPNRRGLGKLYLALAKAYEDKKEIVKARDAYQVILKNYQDVDNIIEVQEKVGALNISIIFSRAITDKDVLYEVEPGDTLINIAKKFGTTVELIKKANSLKSDNIQARSKIKVSKARYKILVDKSQNILTLLADDDIVKVYRVSTGENNSTPVGQFKITNKIVDPVWYTEGAIVPAESPDNILGSRWLGFSMRGYGIHGTIDPRSIGTEATKGCVRMFNPDVEELYVIVPVGTEVTIVD